MFNCTADEQRRCAEDINRWAEAKAIRPIIGREFPLDETAAAEAFLEASTLHGAGTLTGKVVVRIS